MVAVVVSVATVRKGGDRKSVITHPFFTKFAQALELFLQAIRWNAFVFVVYKKSAHDDLLAMHLEGDMGGYGSSMRIGNEAGIYI